MSKRAFKQALAMGDSPSGDWAEIGAAILGDDDSKERGLNRAELRMAVCTAMTCRCGNILDTRRAVLFDIKVGEATALVVLCNICAKRLLAGAKGIGITGTGITPNGRKVIL